MTTSTTLNIKVYQKNGIGFIEFNSDTAGVYHGMLYASITSERWKMLFELVETGVDHSIYHSLFNWTNTIGDEPLDYSI